MSLAAFDDVAAVSTRRYKLKTRGMCPHCRKVVTGKLHVRECAKMAAKSESKGCMDCGDPVIGKRWRCEPCRKEAGKDTAFKTRNRPGQRAIDKQKLRLWQISPAGRAYNVAACRTWRAGNIDKARASSNAWKSRNRDGDRARSKAYYHAHRERINAELREKRRQARMDRGISDRSDAQD